MSKIDENEIRRRLKLLSQIEPAPEAARRAIERVRDTLANEEKRRESTRMWRTILKSPITKLAAAAVIIVAIGLLALLVHRRPGEQADTTTVSEVTKSPVEMMTAMSLERAFRRGGIEAVEKQCKQAFKPIGPRPGSLSVEQILAEFNGDGKSSERTRL